MNDKIQIYDNATGETIVREMTAEEQSRRNAEIAHWLEIKAEKEAELAAKRSSALAKLEALGLNEDDLKALGL